VGIRNTSFGPSFCGQNSVSTPSSICDLMTVQTLWQTTLAEPRRLNPDVDCCFVTGDAGNWTEADLRAFGTRAVLEKPFTADDLSKVLPAV
jgi:hypothetical protein